MQAKLQSCNKNNYLFQSDSDENCYTVNKLSAKWCFLDCKYV